MRKLARGESFIEVCGGIPFRRWSLFMFGSDPKCYGVVIGVGRATSNGGYGYRLRIRWTKNPVRDVARWRKRDGN